MKYLKFVIESKYPLSAASHSAWKLKWYSIAFPTSSYLAESGFTCVTYLLLNICKCLELVNS